MATQRVDYNRIGKRYDSEAVRQRPADPKLVELCLARQSADGAGLRVLDIACGTGIQLVANLAQFPELAQTGLDLHGGMLAAAREKSAKIRWLEGDAGALPFADASFDYVSAQFCFHHFQEKSAALSEVARVLAPGGLFAMLNMTPWRMRDWDIYRYFPETFARDERDFWPEQRIAEELERAGLAAVSLEYRAFESEHELAERRAFCAQRYSPSQLVALADDAFEAGLARMQAELDAAAGAPVRYRTTICLLTLSASRPRAR